MISLLGSKKTFSRAWLRFKFLTDCNGVVQGKKNPVTPTSSILRQAVYKHSDLPKYRFVCFVQGVKLDFVAYRVTTVTRKVPRRFLDRGLRSISNDDGDVNENGKKSNRFRLHVHHAFLYISLPSLHDYNVKIPYFTWRT